MLAGNDNLLAALDKVLQSDFDKRIRMEYQLKCKSLAIHLLVSFLEGRSCDLFVHEILSKEFQPPLLKYVRSSVMRYVAKHEDLKKKKKLKHWKEGEGLTSEMKKLLLNISSDGTIMELALSIMSGVSTLMLELRYVYT